MQINPVIEKELKVKMRGWKAPTLITAYLVFLGLVVFFSFLGNKLLSPYSMEQFNPRVALNAYNSLAVIQLILLIFITPSLTGSAISGERERQTLDLLLCTNLSTFSIVVGKIFVSIAHIMLLIAASLPIMATVFLFGGIKITDLLILFGFFLVTAMMLGSMGIFFSTIFKKNSVSMIVSYITVLAILIGTSIGFGIFSSIFQRINNRPPDYIYNMIFMFANPLYGFGSLIEGGNMGMSLLGIFGMPYYGRYGVPGMPGTTTPSWIMNIQPWMVNAAFDIIISAIFVVFSAWKIKPVKRSLFGALFKRKRKVEPVAAVSDKIENS